MNTLVKDAIKRVYGHFDTPSRLDIIRKDAAARASWWHSIVKELQSTMPDYYVKDFTNLDMDLAFCSEATLVSPKTYIEDDIQLAIANGGVLRSTRLFVSLLGPFAYFSASAMYVSNTDKTLSFRKLQQMDDLDVARVFDVSQQVLLREGFHVLPDSLINEHVMLETDCSSKENTTVFQCLFSDVISP